MNSWSDGGFQTQESVSERRREILEHQWSIRLILDKLWGLRSGGPSNVCVCTEISS